MKPLKSTPLGQSHRLKNIKNNMQGQSWSAKVHMQLRKRKKIQQKLTYGRLQRS
jgi:hypothetical protein